MGQSAAPDCANMHWTQNHRPRWLSAPDIMVVAEHMRHRVIVTLEPDVVVEADRCLAPVGMGEGFRR